MSQDTLSLRATIAREQIYHIETGQTRLPHATTHQRLGQSLDLTEPEREAFDQLYEHLYHERAE